jgi:hypothetical protein
MGNVFLLTPFKYNFSFYLFLLRCGSVQVLVGNIHEGKPDTLRYVQDRTANSELALSGRAVVHLYHVPDTTHGPT